MKKIAILGSGQLSMMLRKSFSKYDFEIEVIALPTADTIGRFAESAIDDISKQLASFDFVTYETENIDIKLLEKLSKNIKINPTQNALSICQDRFLEKNIFIECGINTNKFAEVNSYEDLLTIKNEFDLPFIIKTRRFGYDGKGQYIIHEKDNLDDVWNEISKLKVIAESYVNFDYEVSQVACRDMFGNIIFYPIVKNHHHKGILRETLVLDSLDNSLVQKIQNATQKILDKFDYIGVLAIEFFVKNGNIYANEIAPRVHNSGHWTTKGCDISQFENHMLAISGLKTKKPQKIYSYNLMINLIGEDINQEDFDSLENVEAISYQKDEIRINRKMGHINISTNNYNEFIENINCVYNKIQAKPYLKSYKI